MKARSILLPFAATLDRIVRDAHAQYYEDVAARSRESVGSRSRASVVSDLIWAAIRREFVDGDMVRLLESNGHRALIVGRSGATVNLVFHKLTPELTWTCNQTTLARCASNVERYQLVLPFTDSREDVLEQLPKQMGRYTLCLGYTEQDGALDETYVVCQKDTKLHWGIPLADWVQPSMPVDLAAPKASETELAIRGGGRKRQKYQRA
ncbi:MAG TPA: hypothetical protein ENH80_02805 [Phycisphaerae bacterium]|nr:hypothetical protein [Phycisphaerae bacterium]HDZ42849.1 hypothetical protein [Phycisphaerae bacterium]